MLQHDDPVLFQKQLRTNRNQSNRNPQPPLIVYTVIQHFHNSMTCEQFKEKLSEIQGWGQADRHFAAHYRLFLN
jgi:hypothetical protein